MHHEKDSLGNRMKEYENRYKNYLDAELPVVIRLDMRAGHSFCRHLNKPFDDMFFLAMQGAAEKLVEELPGCRLAYFQSDEISLVLNSENERGKHHLLFGGGVEKLTSVSASIATLGFNKTFADFYDAFSSRGQDMSVYKPLLWTAQFDSRVFNLPSTEEVRNYLMWRIMDARRNSVSMIGRSQFTQKQLHGKTTTDVKKMLEDAGHPIEDWAREKRLGSFVLRIAYDKESENPITKERVTVERHGWKPFGFDIDDITQNWIDGVYAGEYMRYVPNDA